MKYAKIIDSHLEYAPRNKNSISNWINDEEAVLAEGYLPVNLQPIPEGKKQVGYEVIDEAIVRKLEDIPAPTIAEQNEAIRQTREQLYIQTSDKLKADYDEAVARGSDNAEELKTAWLESKDKIREENPYVVESVEEVIAGQVEESEVIEDGLQREETEVVELYSMEI